MKYLILGWGAGIAGGQLYTSNKVEYLLSNGIDTYLGYSNANSYKKDRHSDIILEPLKKIPSCNIKELSYPPSYFSSLKVKKIIKKLLSLINYKNGDEVFIESNGCEFSFWGELVAKNTKGKNFCFLLEGYFSVHNLSENFFRFKISRKEIAGTRQKSLPQLFSNFSKEISDSDNKWFLAYCSNSLSDLNEFDSKRILGDIRLEDYDIKIANVGRALKPYVASLPYEIAKTASYYNDKKILFLMIGGKYEQAPESFKILNNITNLTVFFTGELFPMPKGLIKQMNVCTASSGCISISDKAGATVIAFDDNNPNPLGVIGYSITKYPASESEENTDLFTLLIKIIDKSYFLKYQGKTEGFSKYVDMDISEEFKNQLSYMTVKKPNEYFDTVKILPKDKVNRYFIKLFRQIFPLYYFNKLKSSITSLFKNKTSNTNRKEK